MTRAVQESSRKQIAAVAKRTEERSLTAEELGTASAKQGELVTVTNEEYGNRSEINAPPGTELQLADDDQAPPDLDVYGDRSEIRAPLGTEGAQGALFCASRRKKAKPEFQPNFRLRKFVTKNFR